MSTNGVNAFFIFSLILVLCAAVTTIPAARAAGPNLISNPGVETGATTPTSWLKGGYGTNVRTLTYPVEGYTSAKAVRTDIGSYSSGDAKWYFVPVSVPQLTVLQYSDVYRSDVTSHVTVQFRKSDGTFSYIDIGRLTPSSTWKVFSASFTTPANTVAVTVFHLIKSVGYLETDNFFLGTATADSTNFEKGYISIQFDDGWKEAYQNAYPILNSAGYKTTAFINTNRLRESDFPGYVKAADVLAMQSAGHEIGAHTKSHADLVSLSTSAAQVEIEDSRNVLLSIGATPVNYFAYPFGAYNTSVKQLVKDAGFTAARSSDGGYNTKNQDKFTLRRQPMTNATTLADAKRYIDTARADKTWAILLFHRVDDSGTTYAVTPARFTEIVNYLKQIGENPITMGEGISLMNN